jgi:hypothetical protein
LLLHTAVESQATGANDYHPIHQAPNSLLPLLRSSPAEGGQRTRRERCGCNRRVPAVLRSSPATEDGRAESLSFGR